MKKRIIGLLLIGLFSLNITSINLANAEDRALRKIFSGWMTDYSTYGDTTKGQIQAMDFVVAHADMFAQVHPFWYTLTSATTIKDKYLAQNSIDKAIPISTMQSLGIKVIPTITDGTAEGALSKIMGNDANRATLIKSISDLVTVNNYDGIDLDFEGFAFVDKIATWPTIQPRWVKFITELSTTLHAQSKLLSVTTPYLLDPITGKKGYYFYAWPEISNYIDRLNIMAYDYHKFDTAAGPIGPINWFEPSLIYALKSVAPWKIYIGTPNYGYNWVTKVTGVCPTNTPASEKISSNAAIIHQLKAQAILDKPGAVAIYNEKYGETNILYTAEFNGVNKSNTPTSCKVNHSAWYLDARGYNARAKLVEQYRLGGISEWEIGYGDNLAIEEVKKVAIAMGQDKVVGDVTASAENINYGEGITFNGSFKLADGRPVVNVPVFIELKRPSGNTRKPITQTGPDGTFQTKVLLGESTNISFTTDETWDRTLGITPEKVIGISRVISWNIPASMKHGVAYKVTGQIQPRIAGIKVSLDDGSALASAETLADGKFEITVTTTKIGVKQFRIVTEPETGFIGSMSAFTSVLVR
ncbi:MAG: glycosyl hydrolase family 18 protein [Candidatus Nanopelagicaceae bacterium]